MPTALLKSLASKSKTPIDKVELLWKKAKEIAAKQKREDDFVYIVGVLKRMLGLPEKESYIRDIVSLILSEKLED